MKVCFILSLLSAVALAVPNGYGPPAQSVEIQDGDSQEQLVADTEPADVRIRYTQANSGLDLNRFFGALSANRLESAGQVLVRPIVRQRPQSSYTYSAPVQTPAIVEDSAEDAGATVQVVQPAEPVTQVIDSARAVFQTRPIVRLPATTVVRTRPTTTIVREQPTATIVRQQAPTIVRQQAPTIVRQQATAIVREQPTTTIVREQPTTTIVREQPTATIVRQQTPTVVRQQTAAIVREQPTTTIVREQPTTIVRKQQIVRRRPTVIRVVRPQQQQRIVLRERQQAAFTNDESGEVNFISGNSLRNEAPMSYAFAYSVADRAENNYQSHTSESNNGVTTGSYSHLLPDGSLQIVRYTADPVNGYRAEIERQEGAGPVYVARRQVARAQQVLVREQPAQTFVVREQQAVAPVASVEVASAEDGVQQQVVQHVQEQVVAQPIVRQRVVVPVQKTQRVFIRRPAQVRRVVVNEPTPLRTYQGPIASSESESNAFRNLFSRGNGAYATVSVNGQGYTLNY